MLQLSLPFFPEAETEWNQLMAGGGLNSLRSGKLLRTANWGQGEHYNEKCSGNLTGCVATSMAIIMKYHQWPEKGTGSHTIPGTSYSADFNTTYNWGHMVSTYYPSNSVLISEGKSPVYTEAEIDAVSTLMYHCAVSVNSEFGKNATAAASDAAMRALKTYFGYDKKIDFISKTDYNSTTWEFILKTELDNKRPVIYSGQSPMNGHSFVCDGYNNDGTFHINWGWDGLYNGNFVLSALIPNSEYPNDSYSSQEYMTINIKKIEDEFQFSDLQIVNLGDRTGMLTDHENVSQGDQFNLKVGSIQNNGITTFKGYIAVAITTNDNKIKEIVSVPSSLDPFEVEHYFTDYLFKCHIEKSHIESTDRIRLVTNHHSDIEDLDSWLIVDGKNDRTTNFIKAKGQEITYHKINFPKIFGATIQIGSDCNPDKVVHGWYYHFTVVPDNISHLAIVKANDKLFKYQTNNYYLEYVTSDQTISIEVFDPSLVDKKKTVKISAGELKSKLSSQEQFCIKDLTIIGTIDARDFLILNYEMPALETLDLSDATIVAYGDSPANEIPKDAFNNLPNNDVLKFVTLPNDLTSIGSAAFFACMQLKEITIPKKVNKYGLNVFGACPLLTRVTVKNPEPVFLNWCTFSDRENKTLIVPVGSKAKYQAASEWNVFRTIIEATDPLSTAFVNNEKKTYAHNGVLYLQVSIPTEIQVINVSGVIIRNLHLPAGETCINALESGFYIIKYKDFHINPTCT